MSMPPRVVCRAFTLVEVLLALLLMGVVLTASLRLVRQNLVVEQSMRSRDMARLREDAFFDLVERDLGASTGSGQRLSAPAGTLLRIQTVARFHDDTAESAPLLPAKVTYAIEPHAELKWLVREQINLTLPKPSAERMVLTRDVDTIGMRVYDGQEWQEATEALLDPSPAALAISLQRTGRPAVSQVYLLADAPSKGRPR